jgi:very-short-patch-repair endonuclease
MLHHRMMSGGAMAADRRVVIGQRLAKGLARRARGLRRGHGIRVLRVTNSDILANLDSTLARICQTTRTCQATTEKPLSS